MKVRVPSKSNARERFEVAAGVNIIPLNDLSELIAPHDMYVVVGAGKTGIDACLWLLQHRVSPDTPEDFVRGLMQTRKNEAVWIRHPEIHPFFLSTRLNMGTHKPPLWEVLPWMVRNLRFLWKVRNRAALSDEIYKFLAGLEGIKPKL